MDKTLEKVDVNLNQNLWFLIVSLLGLGFSEYFCLPTLFWFTFILSIGASVSIFVTLFFYTKNYCIKKGKSWKNHSAQDASK